MKNHLFIYNCDIANLTDLSIDRTNIRVIDGIISEIGSNISKEPGDTFVDAKGMLCLPAFVDSHTHLVQSLQKGKLDDLNITDWLIKMLGTQSKLTDEEWYYGVLVGQLQGLRYGTTTFNEMTYYPHIDAAVEAYKDVGLRVTFGLGVTDIAENDKIPILGVDAALEQAETIYNKYHNSNYGLIQTSVAPQGLPACTKELVQAMKKFANQRGLVFHTHLAEGKGETEWVKKTTGYWEAEALHEFGILDNNTLLAHSIWLQDFELDLIAQSGATVVHCPNTNMKLSDGIAPIHKMLQRNVKVALGCDGEASSSNRNMILEARAGSYLQKVSTGLPQALSSKECYEMLTVNGARALGYQDLGEIKIGNKADLLLIDTDEISMINKDARLSNFLYASSGAQVDTVLCEGRIKLRNKEFVDFDIEEVMSKGEEIIRNLYRKL